ncbi:hypothetical protein V1478_006372 [Vespula squamosa]|uniref:Uncharacterized protein n=1 Tax=Vespula squamosa TaxID=30214 RepID=A0ABD2B7Q1_VESSQ
MITLENKVYEFHALRDVLHLEFAQRVYLLAVKSGDSSGGDGSGGGGGGGGSDSGGSGSLVAPLHARPLI